MKSSRQHSCLWLITLMFLTTRAFVYPSILLGEDSRTPLSKVPARPLRVVRPEYPLNAKHKRVHGLVGFRGTISVDGTVKDLAPIGTGDPLLLKNASDAVQQWRFEPAMVNGKPVEEQHIFTIDFRGKQVELGHDDLSPTLPLHPDEDVERELANGTIYKSGPGLTPPRARYTPNPEYSEEARKAKYQGVAVVGTIVDSEGNTRSPWVILPLGEGLDEKALEAVRKWKFEPGTKDGRPVPILIDVEVTFRLR